MGLSLRSRARGARAAGPMSKFVEALEQAARERTLGQSSDGSSSAAPVAPTPAEVGASPDPLPVTEPPHGLLALDEHLVSLLKPSSFEAEQYRALRHLVEHLHRTAELSVVAVSLKKANDGRRRTPSNSRARWPRTPKPGGCWVAGVRPLWRPSKNYAPVSLPGP